MNIRTLLLFFFACAYFYCSGGKRAYKKISADANYVGIETFKPRGFSDSLIFNTVIFSVKNLSGDSIAFASLPCNYNDLHPFTNHMKLYVYFNDSGDWCPYRGQGIILPHEEKIVKVYIYYDDRFIRGKKHNGFPANKSRYRIGIEIFDENRTLGYLSASRSKHIVWSDKLVFKK